MGVDREASACFYEEEMILEQPHRFLQRNACAGGCGEAVGAAYLSVSRESVLPARMSCLDTGTTSKFVYVVK